MQGPPKFGCSFDCRSDTHVREASCYSIKCTDKQGTPYLHCAAFGGPRSASAARFSKPVNVAPVTAPTSAPAEPAGRGIDDDVDAGAAGAGAAKAARRTLAQ